MNYVSRNPFLSRAGFDQGKTKKGGGDNMICRNPFLSRAGFDPSLSIKPQDIETDVAIPF